MVSSSDPAEWSTGHVQKWLLWTEHLYRLPQVGKAFQDLNGSDLCGMSEENFRQRSSQCGDVLYAHLDIWRSGTQPLHTSAHPVSFCVVCFIICLYFILLIVFYSHLAYYYELALFII